MKKSPAKLGGGIKLEPLRPGWLALALALVTGVQAEAALILDCRLPSSSLPQLSPTLVLSLY